MTNPKVVKGDKILLKVNNNGMKSFEGKILEVVRGTTNYINGNILCKSVDGLPNNGNMTVYYGGCADVFVLADRKEQAKYLKVRVKGLTMEIKSLKEEVIFLEKYDSEEEYVAYKLNKILKAKGPKQIAKILKELKTTNYL